MHLRTAWHGFVGRGEDIWLMGEFKHELSSVSQSSGFFRVDYGLVGLVGKSGLMGGGGKLFVEAFRELS